MTDWIKSSRAAGFLLRLADGRSGRVSRSLLERPLSAFSLIMRVHCFFSSLFFSINSTTDQLVLNSAQRWRTSFSSVEISKIRELLHVVVSIATRWRARSNFPKLNRAYTTVC